MQLSLTTFVLEIVNFLVLVWILKRLFFAPVRRVIEERRASVAKTIADAKKVQDQAEAMKAEYDGRLRAWETEKAKARQELGVALAEERARELQAIRASVSSEEEKLKAQQKRRADEERARLEHVAIAQGRQFISRLLTDIASPELESRLLELALARLQREQASGAALLGAVPKDGACQVATAFELSEDRKASVQKSLQALIGPGIRCSFVTNPVLISGVEIQSGAMVLRANLRDELAFFAEAGAR